jgi:hypothetical protein
LLYLSRFVDRLLAAVFTPEWGKYHTETELKLYYFAFSKALLALHYCVGRDAKPTQAEKEAPP